MSYLNFNFDFNESAKEEANRKAYIKEFGIHKIQLTKVESKVVETKNNGDFDVIFFEFKKEGTGLVFEHTEWPKNEEEQKQSQMKRLVHFLVALGNMDKMPVLQEKSKSVNTFKEFADLYVSLFTIPSKFVDAKLVPNNKGYVSFPGYTPILGEAGSLNLSTKERQAIDEVSNFSAPSNPLGAMPTVGNLPTMTPSQESNNSGMPF